MASCTESRIYRNAKYSSAANKDGAKFEQSCFEAAYFGNLENDSHVDFSVRDSRGSTLAHYAAANGQMQALRFMQKAGADLSGKDNDGDTGYIIGYITGYIT